MVENVNVMAYWDVMPYSVIDRYHISEEPAAPVLTDGANMLLLITFIYLSNSYLLFHLTIFVQTFISD
jgi:hypothetical protein